MKRHPKLLELSREHHAALRLALQAREAAASTDEAVLLHIGSACVKAFNAELDPHFHVEENILLPLLLAADEERLALRLQQDHAKLRHLSENLKQTTAPDLLSFGELLTAHVRFEEREMFVALEPLLGA